MLTSPTLLTDQTNGEPKQSIEGSLRRVRAEYLEMPGLNLTQSQMERLCGLDPLTCESLIEALVRAKFLRHNRRGAFIRADRD